MAKEWQLRLGTSGWHYRNWVGPFAPGAHPAQHRQARCQQGELGVDQIGCVALGGSGILG